ncbi:Na+/H+ antiporter NhaC family protein [Rubellicoccus peritrichatus]|uniref:Na+/H+ antiporter NhaC family protein n=1 Tax=Rubellicoccus peritrichatus TaxID=3080537 RepID=A0AAQ3LFL3_9BACT|nr:Na+/H+ antiporter NhaC family protein [Puniceicoccus sp. CR14]WOO43659.1 Na+/H+ antiporter NhaC family protein [Puniceicoccus sp. CR14]
MKFLKAPGFWVTVIGLSVAFFVGRTINPTLLVEKIQLDVKINEEGQAYYIKREVPQILQNVIPVSESKLWPLLGERSNTLPTEESEIVEETKTIDGERVTHYYMLNPRSHYNYWSLLPAVIAVALCFITREPVTALAGGIVTGALLMQRYDLTGDVLIPTIGTSTGATILVLYLWFLGGLMGIWSKNGAALAFAEMVTKRFVRGPKTAKLVAWGLGVLFFQGGTMSTVLVGTTVRPVADKEKVSHEELSFIVDATASPIAVLLPFNAWPFYVQSFIYVGGAAFLATEASRITFFYQSIPLSFYAIFAVLFTFLMSIDKMPFISRTFKDAIKRSRETGQLDRPGAEPLLAKELENAKVPEGYKPNVIEFFIPILLIIGIAIGTYIFMGSSKILWGFGAGMLYAFLSTLIRGMSLKNVINGFTDGLKGVVYGSVILLLAITIGGISKAAGGGLYLVDLLGGSLPYWILPVALQILTMFIAFSTGTSFGTFAVTFPLAMPLAWALAGSAGIENAYLYMLVCFAAVINGSVYGDQCSPISDTTVLSSMATGCDLMDHVRTQIVPCSLAALLAATGWTIIVLVAV